MKIVKGKFKRFIFKSEDTKFFVALFNDVNNLDTYRISGNEEIALETMYEIEMLPSTNVKYKDTFVLNKKTELLPDTREGIIKYFSSDKFPSIGNKMAEKIYDFFGDSVIEDLRQNPSLILDDKLDIPNSKKKIILEVLETHSIKGEIEEFFALKNLSLNLMNKIFKEYRESELPSLWNLVLQNPYVLYEENRRFSFEEADVLGRVLGYEFSDENRLCYYFLSLLEKNLFKTGNTYTHFQNLFYDVIAIFPISKEKFVSIIYLMEQKKIINLIDKKYIQPMWIFDEEKYIVNRLKDVKKFSKKRDYTINVASYLDDIQKNAVINAIEFPLSIITGGPGTGKTEILKSIYKSLKEDFLDEDDLAILAPTGRAAFQISEKTGFYARTIHSFIGARKDGMHYTHNEDNPVNAKVLIVDEFSMVNVVLFSNLLKAFRRNNLEKIILIGDNDQIPAIGYGNLLDDFIKSNFFSVNKLINNYRQKDKLNIINDAQLVNEKKSPELNTKESCLIEVEKNDFLNTLNKQLDMFLSIYSIEEITILSPLYEGKAGINIINDFVQNKLHDSKEAIQIKDRTFYIGDKLIQNENEPDLDVFNGEIGFLKEVIKYQDKISFIIVEFPNGKLVKYNEKQFSNYITLAYCISIHKFQGSESAVILMSLFEEHAVLLSKKLLYTGITRAREFLTIIGTRNAIEIAINENEDSERRTTMLMLFKEKNTLKEGE